MVRKRRILRSLLVTLLLLLLMPNSQLHVVKALEEIHVQSDVADEQSEDLIEEIPTVKVSKVKENRFSKASGNHILRITGTIRGVEEGDKLTVFAQMNDEDAFEIDYLESDGTIQNFKTHEMDVSNLPEGKYTVKIWVEDQEGRVSAEEQLTFYVEGISLDKPLFKKINEVEQDNLIEMEIEIDYPPTAVEKWYKIRNGAWQIYKGPISLVFDTKKVEANLTITARAVDEYGNESVSSIMASRPAPPILTVSPTSVEKGKNVILEWNDDPVYTSYEVWLGTGTSGTSRWDILKKYVKQSTDYSFNTFDLAPGTTVYAYVTGFYGEGERTSKVQSFKVIAATDTQPPTAPVLSTTSINDTSIDVKWTASKDNVGLKEYQVYRNNAFLHYVPINTTSYRYTSLTPATTYTLNVKAVDLAGNVSTSNTLTVKTTGRDTIPPSVPTVTTLAKTHNSVTLSYSATDNVGVTGYRIRMEVTGDQYEHLTTATTHTIDNLRPDRYYYFSVTAYDAEGNSTKSNTHGVKTNPTPIDTQPPTAPVLSAPTKTDKSVSLSWTASTDNVGVVGYDIYVNGAYTATTSSRSYIVQNLTPSTTYSFQVRAKDAAGNTASSNTLNVTTNSLQLSLTLGSSRITESSANDGSFTEKQVVTLSGSTFVADMSNGVTVNNLPPGLSISVSRVSNTQISISFLGKAINHGNQNDVTNASVSIAASKINGATTSVTSGFFTFDFQDPTPSLHLSPEVLRESPNNDGSINDALVVTLLNGKFVADLSSGVSITNLPVGLTANVTRNSDTKLTITFTGKAINHANRDDVNDASVKILRSKIEGALADVISGPLKFDFEDATGAYTYEYNDLNQLIKIKKGDAILYEFSYDANGNLIQKTKR